MHHVKLSRVRPAGTIPFALGVLIFSALGVLLAAGAEVSPGAWACAGGVALAMTALGVAQFRQPHRLELTVDEVLVAPRFGAPRRWQSVRLTESASLVRVWLEVSVIVGAPALLAFALAGASPVHFVVAAGYAYVYSCWRLAPRGALVDARGDSSTVRLDWFPGAVEAIAARG